ncbi:hypothetical protein EHQ27_13705 [Leptospira wolffii]|uniref:DUF485 domain-containing protein n=1 Tax=Leptospira wolffii TaxID=409998 RepID=A0A2M9ZF65_9LEPT|nr:hypothetical protein [Leptospira wolffii]PJZ67081.1 hypothetical protein CH371_03120 [Leptospira wolffii]TGK62058.1 hypothetical protein EHQ32_04260 [Leptospira wolffii]TGK68660.1 hypothetical protein EHQ27_13705 [Leptospira wolffii]TGK74556.1 hypothetical protein EHQ35_09515 [Leptospira wolffii]TGL31868.1 hypothetical protein EHQ57_03160 [Leptospira wolffii]
MSTEKNNLPEDLKEKLDFFVEPPQGQIQEKVPPLLKKKVMLHLVHLKHIRILLITVLILAFSPLSVLLFTDWNFLFQSGLLHAILATSGFLFLLFTVLIGIYLVQNRSPYTKEWKNKLGFDE